MTDVDLSLKKGQVQLSLYYKDMSSSRDHDKCNNQSIYRKLSKHAQNSITKLLEFERVKEIADFNEEAD